MFIYNGFSQTPTRNFQAAGIDFFIPNIDDNNLEQVEIAKEALKKSYKLSDEDIERFWITVDCLATEEQANMFVNQRWNLLHLFYGLKSAIWFIDHKEESYTKKVDYFLDKYLRISNDGKLGVACKFSDMLFINSGIKIALQPYTALEFKNKSGKGTSGWSVKACLVDEDYAGYMHLSMQYLWHDRENGGTVYVGDKLTQGVVFETKTDDAIELTASEYEEKMKNSQRGSDGFGSSDVQH